MVTKEAIIPSLNFRSSAPLQPRCCTQPYNNKRVLSVRNSTNHLTVRRSTTAAAMSRFLVVGGELGERWDRWNLGDGECWEAELWRSVYRRLVFRWLELWRSVGRGLVAWWGVAWERAASNSRWVANARVDWVWWRWTSALWCWSNDVALVEDWCREGERKQECGGEELHGYCWVDVDLRLLLYGSG